MDSTMPQGRIVLKSICQSRKLAALKTDGARLLYTWLLTSVDINGCFSGDPQVIKGQVFTRLKKSTKTILGYIKDLDLVGLIVWYEADGDAFLCIPDFAERQPSLNPDREAKSTIPPPSPEQLQMPSRVNPLKVKESKVKESKRESESKNRFLDFVFLSKEEHSKLIAKFGESRTVSLIEELNSGIGSKGYKYKSHYFTILSWVRRKDKENPPELQFDRKKQREQSRKKIREDYEVYLRAKNTPALKDLRKDKGQISIAHWLIDEILKERTNSVKR